MFSLKNLKICGIFFCSLILELLFFLNINMIYFFSYFLFLLNKSFIYFNFNNSLFFFLLMIMFSFFFLSLLMNSFILKMIIIFNLNISFIFFMSKNWMMFYIFFEFSIIPIFLMISFWGYQIERIQATSFLLGYTLFFSIPAFFIFIYLQFYLLFFNQFPFFFLNIFLKLFFSFMFLVKLPIFLFHIWLPKAHVEAPTVGSIILAAILLKLGAFGIMKILLFFNNNYLIKIIFFIAILGSLFSCFLCVLQTDMKSLIAYSSVVHMNFLLLGLLTFFSFMKNLMILIIIFHAFISSMMFFKAGMIFNFFKTRKIYFISLSSKPILLFLSLMILIFILNFNPPPSLGVIPEFYFFSSIFIFNKMLFFFLLPFGLFSSFFCIYILINFISGKQSMNKNINMSLLIKNIIMITIFFSLNFIILIFYFWIIFSLGLNIFQINFHKFHIVSLSPWPLFMSIFILSMILNLLIFFKTSNTFLFLFLFLIAFVSIFSWWRDVNRESETGFHNFEVRDGLKWGMLLFIFSEVLFFSAWFWAFFHNSLNPSNDLGSLWPPFNIFSMEPFQVPLLNTSILLMSGVTVTWAHHNLFSSKDSFIPLLFTIFLGILFTSFQAMEYLESSFSLAENCYGSSFFVTTGFHGLHVLIGTIFLIFCLKMMNFKSLNKWQHTSFEFAIWYWHFVDVVWLFLFFFMYWWSF